MALVGSFIVVRPISAQALIGRPPALPATTRALGTATGRSFLFTALEGQC